MTPITFVKGLTQKEDNDLAEGFQESQNVSHEKIGSIRSTPKNDVVLNYGAPVHSMNMEGLLSSDPLVTGVGTNLYLGNTVIKSGFSGNSFEFSSLLGNMYFVNTVDGMWEYDTNGVFRAGAPAPSVGSFAAAAGAAGGFTGTYSIYVTFVNRNGFEGNASSAISAAGIVAQNISLTGIPVNSNTDYDIVSRRIWITSGTTPAYSTTVLAATISDNTTTTATLTSTAVDSTTELETDNDTPQAGSFLFENYGVLMMGGISGAENTLYYSKTQLPEQWPVAQGINISRSGDPMVNGLQWNGSGWVLTRKRIFQVIGSPGSGLLSTNFYIKESMSEYGLLAKRAVVATPYGLFFQAEDGLRVFDGNTSSIFSNDIEDVLATRSKIDSIEAMSCMGFYNDLLLFSFAEEGETTPSITCVFDFRTKTWTTHNQGFRSFVADRKNNILFCATETGVERFRNDSTFAAWVAQISDLTTQIDCYSSFGKFQVDMEGEMTVEVYMDDVLTATHSLSSTTRSFQTRRFPRGLFHRASLRMSGSEKSTQDVVHSIGWSAVPQRGKV